jgi:hypothetical protein
MWPGPPAKQRNFPTFEAARVSRESVPSPMRGGVWEEAPTAPASDETRVSRRATSRRSLRQTKQACAHGCAEARARRPQRSRARRPGRLPLAQGKAGVAALPFANLGTEPRRPASPASLLARVCRGGANSSACCATVAARRSGRASPGRSTHRARTRLVRRLQRQQLDGQRQSRRALLRPAKRASPRRRRPAWVWLGRLLSVGGDARTSREARPRRP